MKFFAAAACLAATLIAGQAAAQATTYTFTPPVYGAGGGIVVNTACAGVGECVTYVAGQQATITLTFAAPLAANLPPADRRASVISYTSNDGVRLTTGPGATTALSSATIGTDATGIPSVYTVQVQRTPGPPYNTGSSVDPNSRISRVLVTTTSVDARANYRCDTRTPDAFGPGRCTGIVQDLGYSDGTSNGVTVVTRAAAAVGVPTMTEWAMILFGLLLAGGAALHLQRRRFAA